MSAEVTMQRIKSRPHWQLACRPLRYDRKRIGNVLDLKGILESAKVEYRGWDVPHIDRQYVNTKDYFESWCDWSYFVETVRIYCSGQVVHLFTIRESEKAFWDEHPNLTRRENSHHLLDVARTLYTITEFIEFVHRLANVQCGASLLFDSGLKIEAGIEQTNGLILTSLDPARAWFNDYKCHSTSILFEDELPPTRFSELTLDYSRRITFEFFRHFDWNNPSDDIFREQQSRLLERRL